MLHNMNGLWLDYEWTMYGLWMDYEWTMIGLWMDYEWTMNGLCMDYEWLWNCACFILLAALFFVQYGSLRLIVNSWLYTRSISLINLYISEWEFYYMCISCII